VPSVAAVRGLVVTILKVDATGLIVIERSFVVKLLFESVTWTVKLYVPAVVGVPLTKTQFDGFTQVESFVRDNPGGRGPLVAVRLHVVVSVHDPLDTIGARYQLLTVPVAIGLVVVIITVALAIVIEYALVSVAPPLSLT